MQNIYLYYWQTIFRVTLSLHLFGDVIAIARRDMDLLVFLLLFLKDLIDAQFY